MAYTIDVVNLGQQATGLVITDAIPAHTTYVPASATAGGLLVGENVRWSIPVIKPGETRSFKFKVTVQAGTEVVNDRYAVRCAEGIVAVGVPVVTEVSRGYVYLPLVFKNAQ